MIGAQVCLTFLLCSHQRRVVTTGPAFTGTCLRIRHTRMTPCSVPGQAAKRSGRHSKTKKPFRYKASVPTGGSEGENISALVVDSYNAIRRTILYSLELRDYCAPNQHPSASAAPPARQGHILVQTLQVRGAGSERQHQRHQPSARALHEPPADAASMIPGLGTHPPQPRHGLPREASAGNPEAQTK